MNISHKKKLVLSLLYLTSLVSYGQCSFVSPSLNSINVNGSSSTTYQVCTEDLVFHVQFGNLDQIFGENCAAADCGDTQHPLTNFGLMKNGVNITNQPGVSYYVEPVNCYNYTFTVSYGSPVFGAGSYSGYAMIYQLNYDASCLNHQVSNPGPITVTTATEPDNLCIHGALTEAYALTKANIISAGNTCGPEYYTNIVNGATVGFRAGYCIYLNPRFYAETGSSFFARIEPPCLAGYQRTATSGTLEEQMQTSDSIMPKNNPIEVYPNPNNGKFAINLPVTNDVVSSISLVNALGNTIYSSQLNGSTLDVDISYSSPGFYYLKINYASGKADSRKIILQ